MAEFIDVYKKQDSAEVSETFIDAEAIKDTPVQGALPSGVAAPGLDFAHQNAEAWRLLSEELSEEDYESLRQAVIEKVGEFEEVEPELEEGDE